MTSTTAAASRRRPLPLHSRLLGRRTATGMPEPACAAEMEPALPIRMADGVEALADHYVPLVDHSAPTVLVRTPYGRGFPWDHLFGSHLSRQGFHVVIASCRGTGGSGGEWCLFRGDEQDGADVVTWLRDQPWFDGRLATIGTSYLGYTQLALAATHLPEWKAAVVMSPVTQPGASAWPGGVLALESAIVSGLARVQGAGSFMTFARAGIRLARRFRRVTRELPLLDSYPQAYGGRSDVFEDFLTHPDPDDPHWAGTDQRGRAADLPPALVVGGWWDLLLDQTLDLYARRTGRRSTHLLVGPWTHTSMVDAGWPEVFTAALAFLRGRLGAEEEPVAANDTGAAVRVHVGGRGGGWRDLTGWPPAARLTAWTLVSPGLLMPADAAVEPPASTAPSVIDYDPADPTPSVGGATLGRRGGVVDNSRVEARHDVLLFTSAPLTGDVDVIGPVHARLALQVTGASADAYVRLCDLDPNGVSRNVCDGILRLDDHPEAFTPAGDVVTVPMSSTAHRFARGHRIRIQVAGGSHPRFARNTGTREPVATATRLARVRIAVLHQSDRQSFVVLPTVPTNDGCTD